MLFTVELFWIAARNHWIRTCLFKFKPHIKNWIQNIDTKKYHTDGRSLNIGFYDL